MKKRKLTTFALSLVNEQTLQDPGTFQFDADNSKLSLSVTVGYACVESGNSSCSMSLGNDVFINASLPADKAQLEF